MSEALLEQTALSHARSVDEILSALAAAFNEDGPCPTEHDLIRWLDHCPAEPMAEASRRGALMMTGQETSSCFWTVYEKGGYYAPDILEPIVQVFVFVLYDERKLLRDFRIPALHQAWVDKVYSKTDPIALKHPIAPIVQAWMERPRNVKPDLRKTAILPEALRAARHIEGIERLPAEARPARVGKLKQLERLPGFEPAASAVVPVLPLPVGRFTSAGRGAPIAPRLWFGTQMAVSRLDRGPGRVRLPIALRSIVKWLWPHDWHRGRDMPKLQRGLIELDNLRVRFERMDWRIVSVTALPSNDAHLDDVIVFDLECLPDSDRGPQIDAETLWELGVMAAPAWRTWIRLAYLWDKAKQHNGGYRVYATRPEVLRGGTGGEILDAYGKPLRRRNGALVTNWNDPRAVRTGREEENPAIRHVPVLNTIEIAELGYDDAPLHKDMIGNRARKTRSWLRRMERDGAVVLKWFNKDVQVLEPRKPSKEEKKS